jgi:hypothetical protein
MIELNANATLTDVAFAVCTALDRVGEHAVLCGGSAATYYAPEVYQSRDLDFVLRFGARTREVDEALRPLGYLRAPERFYQHATIPYTVEFSRRSARNRIRNDHETRDAAAWAAASARLYGHRCRARPVHAFLGLG